MLWAGDRMKKREISLVTASNSLLSKSECKYLSYIPVATPFSAMMDCSLIPWATINPSFLKWRVSQMYHINKDSTQYREVLNHCMPFSHFSNSPRTVPPHPFSCPSLPFLLGHLHLQWNQSSLGQVGTGTQGQVIKVSAFSLSLLSGMWVFTGRSYSGQGHLIYLKKDGSELWRLPSLGSLAPTKWNIIAIQFFSVPASSLDIQFKEETKTDFPK